MQYDTTASDVIPNPTVGLETWNVTIELIMNLIM